MMMIFSDINFEDELGMPPALGQLKRRASKGQAEALDDVPLQFKRSKYQDEPTGVEQLPELAMMLSKEEFINDHGHRGWLSQGELNSMSTLLNKVVAGVKIHSDPRRKTFDHPKRKSD